MPTVVPVVAMVLQRYLLTCLGANAGKTFQSEHAAMNRWRLPWPSIHMIRSNRLSGESPVVRGGSRRWPLNVCRNGIIEPVAVAIPAIPYPDGRKGVAFPGYGIASASRPSRPSREQMA